MTNAAAANFDLLQWMDGPARDAFVQCLRPQRYAAGQTIYLQGDVGREMYRIASGSVRLSVSRSDGREVIFLLFEPGDCFGESSLVDDGPRPQTAQAMTDVELQVLDTPAYRRLREGFRAFDDALLHLLARQMRFVSSRYTDLSFNDLRARIAARILEAAQSIGDAGKGGLWLTVPLPQSEIASMVGASRQSVNRALQRLQAEELIATEYHGILIKDVDGLRRLLAQD